MKTWRVLLLAGCPLLLAADCADNQARQQIAELQGRLDSANTELADLKTWLGRSDSAVKRDTMTVHKWHMKVYQAICTLEDKAEIPIGDRMCGRDRDHNAPPKPPPFE